MCPRLLRRGGARRAVSRPAATASFNPATRASISLALTYALWARSASPSSRASATSSSTAADSAKTGNAASSTMRSGLTGRSALISKAVPPPISASRKRSIGKPACEERKVIMMISAEISPTQEHGQTHRQQHHRSGLHGPYADQGYEQVGEGDPEGHPERQFGRPPAALAHRQSQRDDRRNRGEGGPLHPEDEDG